MSLAGMIIGIPGLVVTRVISKRGIDVWARPLRRPASCKHCGGPELRIKATHKRTVKHTRKGNQVMILHLKVPKYHCQSCGRYFRHAFAGLRPRSRPLLDLLVASSSGVGDSLEERRRALKRPLRDGVLEGQEVELEVAEQRMPTLDMFTPQGIESMGIDFKDMFGGMFGRKARKRMTVSEARRILIAEEEEKLIDRSQVEAEALERVEQAGIVFLDEIDKIASREDAARGPDVSREGVQRDLLPIVEGSTVTTKYGAVRTDHVLFIAAGAFHVTKPSDLIPELQGRFPIRVELRALTADDFERILVEPENSLMRQYTALLDTEGVELRFDDEAVRAVAEMAAEINDATENIGARRLHTVMEKLLEEISFDAPDHAGELVAISGSDVRDRLAELIADRDLARYIL